MTHWRVIEATGSSAERRITQLGHSPITGETRANGAIEEASSPWADTGLAQGALPLSQRTGPASSAAAYKDAPDAKSAFFSPAIHRVIFSRFSSRKRRLQLYSMAPSNKTASSKGKTRMYLCPAFGVRTCSSHAALLLRPRLDRSGWPHDGPALPPRTKMTTT